MMSNGWKSKEQIKADYGYSESVFNSRMNECFASPYRDAIISDTSKFSTVIEPKNFLNGAQRISGTRN